MLQPSRGAAEVIITGNKVVGGMYRSGESGEAGDVDATLQVVRIALIDGVVEIVNQPAGVSAKEGEVPVGE
jgi:hypothetical protein